MVRFEAMMNSESRLLTVGGWSFAIVPDGWEIIEGHGIRRGGEGVFPSNVVVVEDQLRDDMTLQQFIEGQLALLRKHLTELETDTYQPTTITGADEAIQVALRHRSQNGKSVFQRQVYARRGQVVGIVTFTTVVEELPQIKPVFDKIMSGFAFTAVTG